MNPKITYTVTPICDKFIARFLYTLYKYSEPNSFRVVVVDQCKNGFSTEVMNYVRPLIHFYIHPCRNLGYAKAHNEAVIHGLRWKTPYICCSNDDIEIMDSRWLDGIWDTFKMDERIMGVVPMNPRVPGWGYGVKYDPELLPYKQEYTKEEYDHLLAGDFTQTPNLPDTFPRKMGGSIVDGAIFIMPYFKRELFEKIADRMSAFGVEYEPDGREPLFMCEAHSEKDVDETLNKLNDAVKYVKQVN